MRNRPLDLRFEEQYEAFVEKQRKGAKGVRLEMLKRDLTGTKALLKVLWSGTFDDLELEYEIASVSGVKIYVDVYHKRLRIAFEADGYVSHAESILVLRGLVEKGLLVKNGGGEHRSHAFELTELAIRLLQRKL